jgi:hypothetical protein
MLILGTRDAGAVVLVDHRGARDDDTTLVNCLDHVSCANVSFLLLSLFFIDAFFRCRTGKISGVQNKLHVLRG